MSEPDFINQEVMIPVNSDKLAGELIVPKDAGGIVVFAHGSGSSRHSPRNKFVAQIIRGKGAGTLLLDLLTSEEEAVDIYTRHLRFDINLLAERLVAAVNWLASQTASKNLRVGFFGASTGGGAALVAAAQLKDKIGAIVSRGGRPDLADVCLPEVVAPVLLIVGGNDDVVIGMNQWAYERLNCPKKLEIIPGATHLFEEPGALEMVAELAAKWFAEYLPAKISGPA